MTPDIQNEVMCHDGKPNTLTFWPCDIVLTGRYLNIQKMPTTCHFGDKHHPMLMILGMGMFFGMGS